MPLFLAHAGDVPDAVRPSMGGKSFDARQILGAYRAALPSPDHPGAEVQVALVPRHGEPDVKRKSYQIASQVAREHLRSADCTVTIVVDDPAIVLEPDAQHDALGHWATAAPHDHGAQQASVADSARKFGTTVTEMAYEASVPADRLRVRANITGATLQALGSASDFSPTLGEALGFAVGLQLGRFQTDALIVSAGLGDCIGSPLYEAVRHCIDVGVTDIFSINELLFANGLPQLGERR